MFWRDSILKRENIEFYVTWMESIKFGNRSKYFGSNDDVSTNCVTQPQTGFIHAVVFKCMSTHLLCLQTEL